MLFIAHYGFEAKESMHNGEFLIIPYVISMIIVFPSIYLYVIFYRWFSFFFGDLVMDSYFMWILLFFLPAFILGYFQWFFFVPSIYRRMRSWIDVNLTKPGSVKRN